MDTDNALRCRRAIRDGGGRSNGRWPHLSRSPLRGVGVCSSGWFALPRACARHAAALLAVGRRECRRAKLIRARRRCRYRLALSGPWVVSGSAEGSLCIWHTSQSAARYTIATHRGLIRSVSLYSADAQMMGVGWKLLVLFHDGDLALWSLPSSHPWDLPQPTIASAAATNARAGGTGAVGGSGVSPRTPRRRGNSLPSNQGPKPAACAFAPGGQALLALRGRDHPAAQCRPLTRQCACTLSRHKLRERRTRIQERSASTLDAARPCGPPSSRRRYQHDQATTSTAAAALAPCVSRSDQACADAADALPHRR